MDLSASAPPGGLGEVLGAARYRSLPDAELMVSGFDVVLQKWRFLTATVIEQLAS